VKPISRAHTEAGPLAELLAIGHFDQRDLVLVAQGNDELLVGVFLARLVQDTHMCLSAVESFRGFAQATGEAIVHESEAENTLEGIEDGHLALGGGVGRDLDLLTGIGSVLLFYVRLFGYAVSHHANNWRVSPGY
jgi:hypothetical protein